MRTNPFAISFGKKSEQRREEPASAVPASQRFGRGILHGRDEQPTVAAAPSSGETGRVADAQGAPVDADTLARLRAWGLPNSQAPAEPHGPADAWTPAPTYGEAADPLVDHDELNADPAGLAHAEPSAETEDAGVGPGTAIDRLRAELGLDDGPARVHACGAG